MQGRGPKFYTTEIGLNGTCLGLATTSFLTFNPTWLNVEWQLYKPATLNLNRLGNRRFIGPTRSPVVVDALQGRSALSFALALLTWASTASNGGGGAVANVSK